MIRVFKLYILQIICLWTFCATAFAQEPYLERFGSKNGLPSNVCYYVFQDSQGFVWLGTDAGVSRYDGTRFENFSVDAGLSDNQVLKIYEDKKGRIWFLPLNGKLSYYYKGMIYNSKNDPLVKLLSQNSVVVSFLEDSKGRIWLGTNDIHIIMWDGQKLHRFTSENPKFKYYNAFMHEDNSGVVRAYTQSSVQVFNKDQFRFEENKELPLSFKTFNVGADGKILFLKADGLYQKSGALTLIKQKINADLLSDNPGYFYADEKEIWLSTAKGVYVIAPNSSYTVYLPGREVNQVMKDKDGNFWFATPSGVYLLPEESERMYNITIADGLSSNAVSSVHKDPYNRIWLGMEKGVLDVLDHKRNFYTSFRIPDIKTKIKQLQSSPQFDALYFATDHQIGRLEDIRFPKPSVSLLREANSAIFAIKNFSIDKKTNLAIALSSGVLRIDSGQFHITMSDVGDDRFFKDRAYKVYHDDDGKLWFSNINGLNGFWNNQVHTFKTSKHSFAERINDIKYIGDNTLALATDGYGILFFKDNKVIKTISVPDGLNSNIVNKLFLDRDYLWVITNVGVNKINIKQSDYDIRTLNYASDLFTNGINDIFVDDDYAYFATGNGLIYQPNKTITYNPKNIKVHITKIELDNEPIEISEERLVLPDQYRVLNVQFSVVDFSNKSIQYRFRLRENTPWINASGYWLEFSALEPGEYNLEIAAKYPGGAWSDSTQFKFSVERKFYQSTWFWVAFSLGLALVIFRVYVILNRRQRNKEKLKFAMQNKILTLEQQALQALMNPHFIFNVMNAIQHYINTQEKNAANKMLTGFARLIRKNLDICSKSYITIEEELEYLKLYLSLEKIRFGEKFEYDIVLDEEIDASELLIPSMLLQPFVENAIWHGLMPRPDMGRVEINIQLNNNLLVIKIMDNGIGLSASKALKNESHVSKGMELTKERIRLINSIEQNLIQLTVSERTEGGTVVSISIPV